MAFITTFTVRRSGWGDDNVILFNITSSRAHCGSCNTNVLETA